ncbi:MAG: FAD-dependent oxidoreductase, partial [archaeon]|nr:FAD-dependent oxidoreductase [archaeon]
MSFKMLKDEIIDLGLCQGCGLCAGLCKHIEMVDLKPELEDFCIVEKQGLKCGKCYDNCPQVKQLSVKKQNPLEIMALQTNDPEIQSKAASGGFVTTLNKYLLNNDIVSHLIEVKNVEDVPRAVVTSDPEDVLKYSGVCYGRTGVLQKLVEVFGADFENIGIVGVPCEIRGAHFIEEKMKKPIFKIGLFCNANMRTKETDKGNVVSPCCNGCPAGVNAAGYINLIRAGKYQESVDLIRETNPLPSICGRICTHECEHGCTLIGTNKPVAIRELKKFVTEWEMEEGKRTKKIKKDGPKVAIIGSGPAGLTSAYYLANLGYQPTIFEKSDKAGGMLRFGVPKFRLPDKTLDYDIETVELLGTEIKYNTPLGPDLSFEDLRNQGYEAIFIAIGQYKPKTLKLEGEDLPNVHTAIDFLVKRKYRYWENQTEFENKEIGILGAGPVAVDVAQTALRLGASKVIMVDIVSEEDLKLVREEIPENEQEFIKFHYDTSTENFTQNLNGKLVFNCHKVTSNKDEKTGRIIFKKKSGSDFSFEIDDIVIAVGQTVDYTLLNAAGGDKLKKVRGKIVIDEISYETNIPGIFAGGDIVSRGKNV